MLIHMVLLICLTMGFSQARAYEVEKLEAGKTLELLEANIHIPAALVAEWGEVVCIDTNSSLCVKSASHFGKIVESYFVSIFMMTIVNAIKDTKIANSQAFKSEVDELISTQHTLEKKLTSALVFSVDDFDERTVSKFPVSTIIAPGMATGISGHLRIPVTKRNESTVNEVYVSTKDPKGLQLNLGFLMSYVPEVVQVKIEDIKADCEQRIAAYRVGGYSIGGDETRLRCRLQDDLGTILFRVSKNH